MFDTNLLNAFKTLIQAGTFQFGRVCHAPCECYSGRCAQLALRPTSVYSNTHGFEGSPTLTEREIIVISGDSEYFSSDIINTILPQLRWKQDYLCLCHMLQAYFSQYENLIIDFQNIPFSDPQEKVLQDHIIDLIQRIRIKLSIYGLKQLENAFTFITE